MRKCICAALPLVVFFSSFQLNAQRGFEIGFLGGASLYSGDLSPNEFGLYFSEFHPAFGAFGRINLGSTLAVRLGVNVGKVSADDADHGREARGLSFRSNITEFSLVGEVNLFRLGASEGRGVVPYVFGGVGVFQFRPESAFDGDYVELQPLGTEGQGLPGYAAPYQLTQVSLPVGLGLKFLLNETITLGFEFGGRKLFTDYLDDVSAGQVNYFDVLEGNGELAARLSNPSLVDPSPENASYRRGGAYNDWYYISGLSLSFRLKGNGRGMGSGRGIGCPTF